MVIEGSETPGKLRQGLGGGRGGGLVLRNVRTLSSLLERQLAAC